MATSIVFATTDYSFFTRPIIHSLVKLGFKITPFDYHRPTFVSRFWGFLGNHHILSKTSRYHRFSSINQALINVCRRRHPRYLLVIKGETITAKTIRTINKLGIYTINWFPDWLVAWPWLKKSAPAYQLFINSCLDTHSHLKKLGLKSVYLPYAAPIDKPRQHLTKIYPVTFVGQVSPRRIEYFSAVKDLGLHIWGYSGWANSRLSDYYHHQTRVAQTQQIIRQSKIVINVLTGADDFQPAAVNVRTFETLGAGTFLLTKYHPILKRHFTLGKDLATFITPRDLRRQVIYYLNHPAQRELIATSGYNRVRRDHTFAIRLRQLFTIASRYALK